MMTQAFCSIRISYLFYASVPLLKIVSPMREAGEGVQSVINEICSQLSLRSAFLCKLSIAGVTEVAAKFSLSEKLTKFLYLHLLYAQYVLIYILLLPIGHMNCRCRARILLKKRSPLNFLFSANVWHQTYRVNKSWKTQHDCQLQPVQHCCDCIVGRAWWKIHSWN